MVLKRSLTNPDAIRVEASTNRRIPSNPYIAQVGALQHSASAEKGTLAACLSRGGTQLSLSGPSCVAQADAHLHSASAQASWLSQHKRQRATSSCVLASRLTQRHLCDIRQAPCQLHMPFADSSPSRSVPLPILALQKRVRSSRQYHSAP